MISSFCCHSLSPRVELKVRPKLDGHFSLTLQIFFISNTASFQNIFFGLFFLFSLLCLCIFSNYSSYSIFFFLFQAWSFSWFHNLSDLFFQKHLFTFCQFPSLLFLTFSFFLCQPFSLSLCLSLCFVPFFSFKTYSLSLFLSLSIHSSSLSYIQAHLPEGRKLFDATYSWKLSGSNCYIRQQSSIVLHLTSGKGSGHPNFF